MDGGSVLTVDLTNRCNMMCDPCFMDANQVGFVHQLELEDIKTLLDNAVTIKPKRQMSVQLRRTDHLAVLPESGSVCARSGLHQRAGCHQRH